MLLLLWVYYASCILLFGAEFTQVYAKATGHEILAAAGAEAVTQEKRAQDGLAPGGACTPAASIGPTVTTEIITVEARATTEHPFGALLAVTAVSFLVGLLTRKSPVAPGAKPAARIREGLADLGADAANQIAEMLLRPKRR